MSMWSTWAVNKMQQCSYCTESCLWKYLFLPKGICNIVPGVTALEAVSQALKQAVLRSCCKTSWRTKAISFWTAASAQLQDENSGRCRQRCQVTTASGGNQYRSSSQHLLSVFQRQSLKSCGLHTCSFLYFLWNPLPNFNQLWARCRDCKANCHPLNLAKRVLQEERATV